MIRVIVADDHPIVRHGLGRLIDLEPDLTLVAEAADGAALLEVLGRQPCDVLVLDLSLPYLRGLELLAAIKERWPTLAVLVFSVHPEDNFSLYLMDAGAAGYLSKDRMIDHVLGAIRCVAAGRLYITDRLAELRQERGSDALAPHQRLSAREHQVFTLMIQGMNVSAIAAELEISASTASNHVSRIREKLGVESNGEILVYAARAGLL
ncbi:MAG: response regulator transcription factor [Nannocystaceae bacterium]